MTEKTECCYTDFFTGKRCCQQPIARLFIRDMDSLEFKKTHKPGDKYHFSCVNHAPLQIRSLTMAGPWEWLSIPVNGEEPSDEKGDA